MIQSVSWLQIASAANDYGLWQISIEILFCGSGALCAIHGLEENGDWHLA
jgi:hypothetical protein